MYNLRGKNKQNFLEFPMNKELQELHTTKGTFSKSKDLNHDKLNTKFGKMGCMITIKYVDALQ